MSISRKALMHALGLASVFVSGILAASLIASTDIDVISSARADPDSGSQQCSKQTLKGAYGIKFEGRKVSGELFASVSRIVFDGHGQFTTSEVGRFNGELVQRTFTGPYTVNGDCTGFLDFSSNLTNPPHEAHGDFVIVDEGREFFVVDNEDGWAAGGIGKRI